MSYGKLLKMINRHFRVYSVFVKTRIALKNAARVSMYTRCEKSHSDTIACRAFFSSADSAGIQRTPIRRGQVLIKAPGRRALSLERHFVAFIGRLFP